ncbi:MAG: HlyD family efflux transporter periplasmic adaptor subunit [bacterium]|nr:HlyD family efflux transporter periplasmic adaptor subunit [bacterium]
MSRTERNGLSKLGTELLRYVVPFIFLAAGVAIAVLLVVLPKGSLPSKPPKPAAPSATAPIELHTSGFEIRASGVVTPARDVILASEISGRIESKDPLCEEGVPLKEGHPLLTIDSYNYKFDVSRLLEEKNKAAAALVELSTELAGKEKEAPYVKRELELKIAEYKRQADLGAVTTDSELDQYEQQVVTAQNKLQTLLNQIDLYTARKASAEASVALATLQHEKAVHDLEKATIKAPFDGVVLTEHVEEGAFVQIGAPLVTMEDTSSAEVLCHLRVEQLRWILGQHLVRDNNLNAYSLPKLTCDIILDIGGDEYVWEGKLDRYQGVGLDPKTRTVPCIIKVANPKEIKSRDPGVAALGPQALVREMFVTVKIKVNPPETIQLFKAPERAVRPGGVIILETPEGLRSVRVAVAQVIDHEVIVRPIAGGLQAGDRAIISPVDLEKL